VKKKAELKMRFTKSLGAVMGTMAVIGSLASSVYADEKMNALDKQFMRKVSQGNIAEIKTGQLALKKSNNKDVRMIASMLVTQHGVAQKDLKSVARLHQFSLPATPDPAQRAQFRMLSRMSGASFDKAFMKGQVRSHNATVALFNKEMEDGNETHVRSYAAKYLPDIQTHTKMIHNVASNLGISVAAPKMAAK
jgi:putative membrane protein